MVVQYLSEGEPVQENYNSAADDFTTEVVYRYDLELDSTDQLVGGEWYTNSHPDFLWVPVRGTKARSEADRSMLRMGEPKFSEIPFQRVIAIMREEHQEEWPLSLK